tara:strand:+ start:217 stop:435 length:219 start_codon:yes stop_codon:yes gene_type:complete
MTATLKQIKKANKKLNTYGLNMSKLDNKEIHVGIISIDDFSNNEVLNMLNTINYEISRNIKFHDIACMSYFY